ncbi:MAG: hypothetical protein ACI3XQ_04435 [Eubacteriales bacterium]
MKKTVKFLCILSAVVFLLSGLLISSPAAASPLDFSHPDRNDNRDIAPSELLEMLLPGAEIDEDEKEYVDTYFSYVPMINESFSNDTISVICTDGRIFAEVEPYVYVAANSVTVNYIPTRAGIDGEYIGLTYGADGKYTCEFDAPEPSLPGGKHITVEYTCSLSIPADTANELINFAYADACEALRLEAEYRGVLGDYLDSFERYRQYLEDMEQYAVDSERYERYLAAKAEYDRDYAEYTEYLAELAVYRAAMAEYEKYCAELAQYELDRAAYEKAYAENKDAVDRYRAYLAALSATKNSMYAIESLYVKPDNGTGSLYHALQNKELTEQFDKNKSTLVSIYGVDGALIDEMSRISEELNELLRGYSDAREESEKAAFEFYKQNYSDICGKFNYLYDKMNEIVTPTIFNHICTKVDIEYKSDPTMAEYKKWRIKNVLSHIYLVCLCLDDSANAAGAWSFYDNSGDPHTYYFPDLLASNEIITDTNTADPRSLTWPEPVEEAVMPKMPTKPKYVPKPLAPEQVEEPTAPTPAEKPTEPEEVADPGDPPQQFEIIVNAADIRELLENGILCERQEFSADAEITLTCERTKLISPENNKILTLLDYDCRTVLYETELVSGADVTYPDITPTRASDRARTYEFSGWSLSPCGEPITSAPIFADEDICLYALYSSSPRYYDITWNVDGSEHTVSVKYGEVPVCPVSTEKAPDATTVYTFSGWSPTVSAVRGDAEYTANYLQSDRYYSVEWRFEGGSAVRKYTYGSIPDFSVPESTFYDGCTRYDFDAWSPVPSEVTGDAVYTALYDENVLAAAVGDASLSMSVSTGAYTLRTDSGSIEIKLGDLLGSAQTEGKRIDIVTALGTFSLSRDAVRSAASLGVDTLSLSFLTDGDGRLSGFYAGSTAQGQAIAVAGDMRVRFAVDHAAAENLCVDAVFGTARKHMDTSYSSGYMTFVADVNTDYDITARYHVTLVAPENGAVFTDSSVFYAGEKVVLNIYPASGYVTDTVTLTSTDGTGSTVLGAVREFVMPDGDVTVTVTFKKREYSVVFVSRGETVAEFCHNLGDTVQPPEIAASFEEDGYIYTFVGWSPAISPVTGDVTYTAIYNSSLVGNAGDMGGEGAFERFLSQMALPIAVAFLLLIAIAFAVIAAVVATRRRRKG